MGQYTDLLFKGIHLSLSLSRAARDSVMASRPHAADGRRMEERGGASYSNFLTLFIVFGSGARVSLFISGGLQQFDSQTVEDETPNQR